MTFLEYITSQGLVDESAQAALVERAKTNEGGLEAALLEGGVAPKALLAAKGVFYGLPTRDTGAKSIPSETLRYIPEESARHYGFVPLGVESGVLAVGITDPENIAAKDALQLIAIRAGMPFKLYAITQKDFLSAVEGYKGLTIEVAKAVSELEKDFKDEGTELIKNEALEGGGKAGGKIDAKIVEDAPITKIVAVILRHATEGNASDVHIEHMGDKVRVRFRVDGVLYTSIILPASVHNAVVARIKILTSLRLDERRKPQDGRFSARIDGRKIDFRVSTFPAYYGEKVVMRILDPEKGVKPINAMGLTPGNLATLRRGLDRNYGMILITGPTGSGKTTTLYSMLNEIDRETENVVSLEDPVEYNIPGMNQSQVRPEIDYTFSNGLRSILRQDPDIIMVGEIRDKETAQLAIQAALTGHLVLSTLHTNSAIGAIPRLVDMGVDPYLIAPTLILTIAQRLVRTLCPDEGSRTKVPFDGATQAMLEKQFADLDPIYRKEILTGDTFYSATPTPDCPSGTRGRIAVFEMLEIDKDIENIILKNPVEPELWRVARSKGMTTMKEDAIHKALDGVIPFEEIYKV
ncbi:MAG: GspE/PulE family protein [Minisyncoccota bacterium]